MSATTDVGAEQPETTDVPELDLEPRIEALKTFLARRPPRQHTMGPEEDPFSPPAVVKLPTASPTPLQPDRIPHLTERSSSPIPDEWTRRLAIVGATALAVVTALVLVVAGVPASFRAMGTGTLSIDTRPSGVAVVVDGTPRGVTPVEIELAPGDHVAELIAGSNRRRVPVTIRAGSQSSQFLEMTGAPAAAA